MNHKPLKNKNPLVHTDDKYTHAHIHTQETGKGGLVVRAE